MSGRPVKNRPRLVDIAARAGVSVTTASLALSSKGRISAEVRERVRSVADELGYTQADRRRTRTGTSAVLCITDRSWNYAWGMNLAIIDSLQATLRAEGRESYLVPVSEAEATDAIWNRLQTLRADSVFSIHFGHSKLFRRLEEGGIPVVVVMNSNYQSEFHSVCVDDYHGAYDAGRILLEQGHRVCAYLWMDLPILTAVRRDRLVGFRKALEEAGHALPEAYQPVCAVHGQEDVDRSVAELMSLHPRPTGLYVMDDYLGVRVAAAVRKLGLEVPGDVSILCAGDVLDYDEPYVPRLSTMRIQFSSMGRAAGELLRSRLSDAEGSTEHEVLKVKQHYVDRGTVGPAPRA